MEFNNDFEKEIFTNVNVFTSYFNSIDLNEKNILEMISIAFYGAKYISCSELQINNNNFDKYIKLCINHYVNMIVKEVSYFQHFSKDEYNNKTNNLENEINIYIQKLQDENNNYMSYKAILHSITTFVKSTFVKSRFMNHKNENAYILNSLYKKLFDKKYNAIDCLKYIEYLIIVEQLENVCSIISLSKYNNFITKNDIMYIKSECENNYQESLFLYKIYKKMISNNAFNIQFKEFEEFIQNILKNSLKTPYYYEDKYKSIFKNILEDITTKMNQILTPEHTKLFNFIKNIKENIIQKGIETNDSMDEAFPNICISEIVNNKLNINEKTTKMFYDYFMTFKSEAKNALSRNQEISSNLH